MSSITTPPAVIRTGCHRSPLTSPLVSGFAMAETEKADLIAFLEALTDYSFLANPEHQSPFR